MRELSVAEQRYAAVLAVIADGLSVSQVAEKVGVSRQTLHAWLAHYEAGERQHDLGGGPAANFTTRLLAESATAKTAPEVGL